MPDRNLPSRHGFLDGFIYLMAGFYILYGLVWHIIEPPSKLAFIPWFHDSINDDMFGTSLIILGAVIGLVHSFCTSYKGRMVSTIITMLTALVPGVTFVLAWTAGYYSRGLLVGVPMLFLATLTLWISRRTSKEIRRDQEDLMRARREGL